MFSNSSTIGRESNSSLPLECKKKQSGLPRFGNKWTPHDSSQSAHNTRQNTYLSRYLAKNTYLSRYLAKNTYLSRYLAKNTYLSRYLAKQQFFLSRPTLQNQLCTLFYTSKRCFWKRFLFLCPESSLFSRTNSCAKRHFFLVRVVFSFPRWQTILLEKIWIYIFFSFPK